VVERQRHASDVHGQITTIAAQGREVILAGDVLVEEDDADPRRARRRLEEGRWPNDTDFAGWDYSQ
jgi:multidrug resistance efflux pump